MEHPPIRPISYIPVFVPIVKVSETLLPDRETDECETNENNPLYILLELPNCIVEVRVSEAIDIVAKLAAVPK